jgi:hypothetical protein
MNVVVPIFHFHQSARFWPEPQKFDPARFSPERRPPPEPMIYFPFGAGPRNCIGNHFALQELAIMTILFLRHYQFRLQPGFAVKPDPLITLRPEGGVAMTVRAREPLPESHPDGATSHNLAGVSYTLPQGPSATTLKPVPDSDADLSGDDKTRANPNKGSQ